MKNKLIFPHTIFPNIQKAWIKPIAWQKLSNTSGILRDKTIDDKLMYKKGGKV